MTPTAFRRWFLAPLFEILLPRFTHLEKRMSDLDTAVARVSADVDAAVAATTAESNAIVSEIKALSDALANGNTDGGAAAAALNTLADRIEANTASQVQSTQDLATSLQPAAPAPAPVAPSDPSTPVDGAPVTPPDGSGSAGTSGDPQ